MERIYEVPVYDGATKEWRVLNLSTGSVYSSHYATSQIAWDSIEDGQIRGGRFGGRVTRVSLADVRLAIDDYAAAALGTPCPHGTPDGVVCALCLDDKPVTSAQSQAYIDGDPDWRSARNIDDEPATREEQHGRYLDSGPQAWDDRDSGIDR